MHLIGSAIQQCRSIQAVNAKGDSNKYADKCAEAKSRLHSFLSEHLPIGCATDLSNFPRSAALHLATRTRTRLETQSEVHLERERIRRGLAYRAIEKYWEVSFNKISLEEAALALDRPTVVYQRHNSP